MAKVKDKPEGVAAVVELGPEDRRDPDEWCRRLERGRMIYLEAKHVWQPCWQHAAARVLHGWGKHQHHAGAPMLLTRDEYEAALRAAEPEVGVPVPVPSCTSPYLNFMM